MGESRGPGTARRPGPSEAGPYPAYRRCGGYLPDAGPGTPRALAPALGSARRLIGHDNAVANTLALEIVTDTITTIQPDVSDGSALGCQARRGRPPGRKGGAHGDGRGGRGGGGGGERGDAGGGAAPTLA